MLVKKKVHTDENAGSVVADHEHVHSQDSYREASSNRRMILKSSLDVSLVHELLYPNQGSWNQLQEVQVFALVDQRHQVPHNDNEVERELGRHIVADNHVSVVNDLPLSKSIVTLEQTEEDV